MSSFHTPLNEGGSEGRSSSTGSGAGNLRPSSIASRHRQRSGGGIPRSPHQSTLKRPHSNNSTGHGNDSPFGTDNVDRTMNMIMGNDPTESKLIQSLEENRGSLSSSSPRGRQRKISANAAAGSARAFKLHSALAKQRSNRRLLDHSSSRQHDDGKEDTEESTSYDAISSSLTGSNNRVRANTLPNEGDQQVQQLRRPDSNRSNGSYDRGSLASVGSSRRGTRRMSAQARDLRGPTSEFLSSLTSKFDHFYEDFDENEEDNNSHANKSKDQCSPNHPFQTKNPSKGGHHRRMRTTTDNLIDNAQHLESLFVVEDPNDLPKEIYHHNSQHQNEGDAFVSQTYSDFSDDEGHINHNVGDMEEGGDVRRPLLPGRRQAPNPQRSCFKRILAHIQAMFAIIGPQDICKGIGNFLLKSVLCGVVPLLGAAAVLFYGFKNPNFHFMPSDATMAWWLIFAARLVITFNLARATQYFLEVLTTRTTLIVRIAGPFVALVAMQSLGWPFLLTAFGAWTTLLMRGDHSFVKNWAWFLRIGMLSRDQNGDGGVLESELYGRVLVACIFVGAATAAKRTCVALYLSRRMLQYYRQQLRELLGDMKIIMEVAELAAETQTDEFKKMMQDEKIFYKESVRSVEGINSNPISTGGDIALTALKATSSKKYGSHAATADILTKPSSDEEDESSDTDYDGEDDDLFISDEDDDDQFPSRPAYTGTPISARSGKSGGTENFSIAPSKASLSTSGGRSSQVQWSELKDQVKAKRPTMMMREGASSPIEMLSSEAEVKRRAKKSNSRGIDKLLPRLDRWEEPEAKTSKKMPPSLHDILQFRKAMEFMDNPYCFSTAFGLARNRRECIKSSARVYKRLLDFTPGDSVLHFDVIGALAYDENDKLDEKRVQSLLHIFMPDKDDLLPQLSFVQSVDYVYKSLRFLRASIMNSSKIDSVLEDVFDVIYNVILALIVLTMIGINIWPLLVSFSTVMVSFAFSFGPSCAKYIEGTLMIAVRRPYDIGDRITIISGESITQPTEDDTWLVEDITLSTTVLRFAATNEVSTINNAALSMSRIVNGARSTKAIVQIAIRFEVTATQEQIEYFRIRVENYLFDRPEIWSGMVHFRNDVVDYNLGFVTYLMRVQHQRSWQDMPPIMVHKGELERYTNAVGTDLKIVWRSLHKRMRIMECPTIKHTTETREEVEETLQQSIKEETIYAVPQGRNRTLSRPVL